MAKQWPDRLWSKAIKLPNGCWVWQGCKAGEYGMVRHPVTQKMVLAHRAAYEVAHGTIDETLDICHTCDNPPCINPEHLFQGTTLWNMRDSVAKDRHGKKLCIKDVLEIRQRHSNGESQYTLARAFGVHQSNISCIVTNKIWREEVISAST